MNKRCLKTIALLLLLMMVAFVMCGCEKAPEAPIKLSFKAASGYDYLKSINGKTVTISGYMATSSPVDGSVMFLMNLPYQSCPFCVPNTSQLSNTMEVYPKDGDAFGYTTQAIKVVGTLVVAEKEDEPFTDRYGYQFNYKIVDATYTIIQAEELSADMALWQKIASTDVISDIYAMGGVPKLAMNLICFPSCLKLDIMEEILQGGYSKVIEAGAIICGGHTIEDSEPKYGLCVTGYVHPKDILANSTAKEGDVLVLTKSLGTGVLSTAAMGDFLEK